MPDNISVVPKLFFKNIKLIKFGTKYYKLMQQHFYIWTFELGVSRETRMLNRTVLNERVDIWPKMAKYLPGLFERICK